MLYGLIHLLPGWQTTSDRAPTTKWAAWPERHSMIQGLVTGMLKSTPINQKMGDGPPVALATLIAVCSDGEIKTVAVCAIGSATSNLLCLKKGDNVVAYGPLSIVDLVDKQGNHQQAFSMVATKVTNQYDHLDLVT